MLRQRLRLQCAKFGLAACLAFTPAATAAEPPRLGLPVACEPGKTCFIQHYVDLDPTTTVGDYRCNGASYDGHDGTDIRLLSATAARDGYPVVAAAAGKVSRVRDGMADVFSRDIGKRAITNRECGNAVIIEHAGGLETQYCHLQHGSVVARPGQHVERGDPLAKVGYSGAADFAHLHFTVRLKGRIVDPFSGQPGGRDATGNTTCGSAFTGDSSHSMWQPGLVDRLGYRPSEIIQIGFASELPKWDDLERDHERVASVTPSSPIQVFARSMNLSHGDTIVIRLEGPGGLRLDETLQPIERHQAIHVAGAGWRLGSRRRWPVGLYRGSVEIRRAGATVSKAATSIDLR